MHGFKLQIGLEMPTPMERPDDVRLCDECHMKHAPKDECWDGVLPSGMLPLPMLDGQTTGREMVDKPMKPKRKDK